MSASHRHPLITRILAAALVTGMAAPAFRVFLNSGPAAAEASTVRTTSAAVTAAQSAPDPALTNAATATLEAMLAALPSGYDEVDRQTTGGRTTGGRTTGGTTPWGQSAGGDCRAVLDIAVPDAQVATLQVSRQGGLPEVAAAAAVFGSVSEAEAALGSVDPTSPAGRCWHEGLVRGLLGDGVGESPVRLADADLVKGRACSCERSVAAVTQRYIVETSGAPITVYVEAVQVDATVMLVTTQVPADPGDDLPNRIRHNVLLAGARFLAGQPASGTPVIETGVVTADPVP